MPPKALETPDPTELSERLNERSVALMAAVKLGNHGAFTELVQMHQQSVVGTAMRLLGNIEDAHDVAQQVFVRIWKSSVRYEPTAKFTTWMFTILRNLAFNEYRRRGRHPLQSLDADEEEFGHQLTDHATVSPDAAVEHQELEGLVEEAIAALPENQRLALSLRHQEGMAYEEIAEVLQMSLSAVKSLIFRARQELKDRLKHHFSVKD